MTRPLVLAFMVFVLIGCAGKNSDISEPEKMMGDFFGVYGQSGPSKALKELLSKNEYITPATIDSVSAQMERLIKNLGEYHGYEKVSESTYGKSISHLSYVVKYSRQPLRLNFNFYQPADRWIIHNFTYETNFLNELDETNRAVQLKENR